MSFLAQRVHVYEILRYIFPILPHPLKVCLCPTGTILAIFYSKVPHMLHAKYQANWHSSSEEEVVFTIYGHGGHLEFRKIIFFS